MSSYLLRRLISLLPTLLAATFLIFLFIRLIPGDPAAVMLGDAATPEQAAALREKLGLNRPILTQYALWLGRALTGDLGDSIFFRTSVVGVIADGAETSILLALLTMFWIVLFGVPAGVIAAARHGSWPDQIFSGAAILAASVPTFWLGLYLILIFSAGLGWLPAGGYPSIFGEGGLSNLRYMILPSITLAAPNAALIIRLTRAGMLDVMREDFVRTAQAKGISSTRVLLRHVLRNALIGVVSAFGFTFAALISEAVVTETVFSLPGIGRLVVQSVLRRDYPVIQGVMLTIVMLYLLINLAVDLLCAQLDPRVQIS